LQIEDFLFSDAVTTNAEVGGQVFFAIIPPFKKWLAKLSDSGEAREVQWGSQSIVEAIISVKEAL
jgi:hypothetical protein